MVTIGLILGWALAILFGLLTVSMLLMRNWLHALVLLMVVLLCLPPVSAFLESQYDVSLHPLVRSIAVVVLLVVFGRLLLGGEATSIYASPEAKGQFMQLYDEKMADWPAPYEDVFLDTEYGVVHVIVSGPEDAPPMVLLHASGVGGWSWKHNVEALSQKYRTYAIDLIGDVGKSEFTTLDHVMQSGQDQARLYAEITGKLGVDRAYVVGASEGGFIGSNYALHYPDRVEKLVLLGPMGYAGATKSIMRITLAQFFPLKPLQESTFRWAFSNSAELVEEFGPWFRLLMNEAAPRKVAPLPLSAEERQGIRVPVLFVFGERDNLVGNPGVATALVQDMHDVEVKTIDAGHLMGAEKPEQVNTFILGFATQGD